MDEKLIRLVNQRYDELSQKIDSYKDEIDKFKDKVYDRMDAVYKEVLSIRQEQAAHAGGHQRINDNLDDHEKRLKKLESPSITAHQIHK